MEEFPAIGFKSRYPIQICLYPFLQDHRIATGAVLPAVQSMQILASLITDQFPGYCSTTLQNVSFVKLLHLPAETKQIAAFCEAEILENKQLQLKLLTKSRSKSGIVRSLLHACLEVGQGPEKQIASVFNGEDNFDGQIPVSDIYPGLVSFGENFQNIVEPVKVNDRGAITKVFGGNPVPGPGTLGSPFPLDAAFQAACAWGRYYTQRICFPVSFQKRSIVRPTRPLENYKTIIRLKSQVVETLEFDLSLQDDSGDLYEQLEGLKMKEIGIGSVQHHG